MNSVFHTEAIFSVTNKDRYVRLNRIWRLFLSVKLLQIGRNYLIKALCVITCPYLRINIFNNILHAYKHYDTCITISIIKLL